MERSRWSLLLALAPLAACGHISNAPIEADAEFLAAFPDRARQALLAPGEPEEDHSEGEVRLEPGPLLPEQGHAASRARTVQDGVLTPTVGRGTEPGEPEPTWAPEGGGRVFLGEWSDEQHTEHGRVDGLDPATPRFSPIVQTREALETLQASFEEVFVAAELVRDGLPASSEATVRAWEDLPWHGGVLDAGIEHLGDADYAWSMSGADGSVFLDGAHAGYPTMDTGAGEFRFDQAAWAAAYGLEGAGVVTVAYDNRAGVELELALEGVQYEDPSAACAGEASRFVVLGPAQRYQRANDLGDYQFVTERLHGCSDEARSQVRARWVGEDVRIDERVRTGVAGRWTWSQCWSGGVDDGELVYEQLVVGMGSGKGEVRIAQGSEADCGFPTFAEVSGEVLSGG